MRKHLIGWQGTGLLCAALSTAAIAQDRPTPEAAGESSLTTSTSSFAIQARQRLKDPEQRKVLRASNRQLIEQGLASLDEVLPLDANTRSRLLELLTDIALESAERSANEPLGPRVSPTYPSWEALQAAVERERFGDNELQRSAAQWTRDQQRIGNLLGKPRFQQYNDYLTNAVQRQEVARFDAQLPTGNKLDASQRPRLMLLLNEWRQEDDEARQLQSARDAGERARRGYTVSAAEGDANLRELRSYEQQLQQAVASSKQLLAQLASLLTPPQLAVYEANETQKLAQELQIAKRMRKRAGVDPEKVPILPPDPAAAVSPRTPLGGRVQLEVTIKVNASAVTRQSLLADNGRPVTFEVAPLTIEAVPILFDDGWRELTLKFYEPDGRGGRRRVIPNTWGAGIMVGDAPVQKLDALVLTPSRGYAIVGNLELSAAKP